MAVPTAPGKGHAAHIDALTHTLGSRSTLVGGLLTGALTVLLGRTEATAHDPLPACRRIKNAQRRQAYPRRARGQLQRV